jgi:DeoR/GlpR family transcriptional regulator of sugar metabolism
VLTQQRKQLILRKLKAEGQIVAASLSAELGLSEDTLRRDLRALAAEGRLRRVHGGALPASPADGDLTARSTLEVTGKRAIARTAARMVRPGQVVFVDGGTTCGHLVQELAPELNATVVTHSPTVACALIAHPRVEVLLIGGRLFKHSGVSVGAAAAESIAQVRADLYFMGVTGVRAREGLSTGDFEEAQVKRAMLTHAAETWVLASSEKLQAASAYKVARCNEVTGLIVERDAQTRAFERLGVAVMRASKT